MFDTSGFKSLERNEAFVLGYMHNMADGAPLSAYDREQLGYYLKSNEIEKALKNLADMGLIQMTYCK